LLEAVNFTGYRLIRRTLTTQRKLNLLMPVTVVVIHYMSQYNCTKKWNVLRQKRTATPYLWPIKVEAYSPSKAVGQNLGKELAIESPTIIKLERSRQQD